MLPLRIRHYRINFRTRISFLICLICRLYFCAHTDICSSHNHYLRVSVRHKFLSRDFNDKVCGVPFAVKLDCNLAAKAIMILESA